jgi:hypothetical protein
MQMVAADWLRSDKREDDLGGRPGSIVQVGFFALVFWFLILIIFSHQETTCFIFLYRKINFTVFLICRNMQHRVGLSSSSL